jgi:hypothetical protein
MPIQAHKINTIIDNVHTLVESLTLTENSEQSPAYLLNNSLPYDYTPNRIKNTLNISYFVQPSGEINLSKISTWKSSTTGNLEYVFNIGNIIFTGYLDSFSFSLIPNQTVIGEATYSIFNPITGNFINQSSSDSNLYNAKNTSGLAHYWTAFLSSGGVEISDNNILQLDYNFSAQFQPIFSLGRIYPSQISTLSANEEINVLNETQNNPIFSGQNANYNVLGGIDLIRLRTINRLWTTSNVFNVTIDISNMEVQSERINISPGNLVVFNHNISKNY